MANPNPNTYEIGDKVRIKATFTVSSVKTDPTTITLRVKDPSGIITVYTYVGGTITKDATGMYHRDISITQSGEWFYRWEGTGAVETADEAYLVVENSEF